MSERPVAPADPHSPLADPALRLGAFTLDVLAPAAPFVLALPVGIGLRSSAVVHAGLWAWAGLTCVLALVNLVLLHRHGQTVGKRLLGLRIVRSNGERATLARLFFLRGLVPGLLGAVPCLGAVFALVDPLVIFSDTRQTLHDRIADTIVVDVRRPGPPEKPAEF